MALEASLLVTPENIQKAYIAYFGRPADAGGLLFWQSAGAGTTMVDVMNSFSQSGEYAATYPDSANQFALVNSIYQNLFGHAADAAGATYWVNALVTGAVTPGLVAYNIARGAQGSDLAALNSKVAFASAYTAALLANPAAAAAYNASAIAAARTQLSAIDTVAESTAAIAGLPAQIAELGNPTPPPTPDPVVSYRLTTGPDDLQGSSLADTFTARVVQNINGEQTNQLATGDAIDGRAGTDTLNAKVQAASALNDYPGAAIEPETVDVEVANFTALDAYQADGDVQVIINAKDMLGLDKVGSVQSDVDLIIENLTTLRDNGVYADRRLTEDLTVRMDHTGNGEEVDDAADLTVLLDQDYLLSRGDIKLGATMTIELMDMDAALFPSTSGTPLLDNPYGKITFRIGGVTKTLDFGVNADTYAQLETAVRAAITAQAAIDPIFGQLTVTRVVNGFTANDTDSEPGGSAYGDTIVITNSGPEQLEAISMTATGDAPAGKDFHTNFDDTEPGDQGYLITINVELEKVGRGADGGDLTIGGMSTPAGYTSDNPTDLPNNRYVAGDQSAGDQYKSIQQFEVTVSGDATQWSSLASLQATNNRLEVVNVYSATGSAADLIIGNSETEEQHYFNDGQADIVDVPNGADQSDDDLTTAKNWGLKDVRVFDSSAFSNDVELHAYLSNEIQAKYLNEGDLVDDATADNVEFNYTFGGGNDLFNVNVDKTNLTMDNASVSEDFVMNVTMGNGDDHFQGQIGNGHGEDFDDSVNATSANAWYTNLVVNATADDTPTELNVATGAGNDVIEVWGSGRWNIDAGSGNDAIYSDNSGNDNTNSRDGSVDFEDSNDRNFNEGRAVWVLNTSDQTTNLNSAIFGAVDRNINNLRSDSIDDNGPLFRSYLSVSLRGYESDEVQITSYNSTDTDLNNAIKRAIANDVHMSKLLVAEDGPGGTLVIRSLVDGDFLDEDFGFSLRAPTTAEFGTMSSGQIAAFNAATGLSVTTAVGALDAVEDAIADFQSDSQDIESGDDADYVVQLAEIWDENALFVEEIDGEASGGYPTGYYGSYVSNQIEAGLGLDTVSLTTSQSIIRLLDGEPVPFGVEGVDIVEDVNVADTEIYTGNTVQDLVFNATNANITFDADDLIVTSWGALITTASTATVEVRNNPYIGGPTVTLAGGAGAQSLSLTVGVTETYIFASTASGNGVDAITGFEAGTDGLDFSAFLSSASSTVSYTPYTSSSNSEVDISNSVVLYDNGATALTAATLLAEFGTGQPFLATTSKAVVLSGNDASAGTVQIWYVSNLDSDNVESGEIVLVGTLANVDLGNISTGILVD